MSRKSFKTLTIEEKLKMLTGCDGFSAVKLPWLEKNGLRMSDGPFGVKNTEKESVCFPNTCLMASSFDRDMCYRIGKMIGGECRRADINLLLAPAINIKRSPLTGRNFEYYSEDPFVTGELASAFAEGLRSEKVGACVKHFACNNQELQRWTQNSVVDEDTLRNIYLKAFEIIVRRGGADAVMTSYNSINGEHSCANGKLLKDILRKEWGFKGITISDWASVVGLVNSLKNGLDLEMPGNADISYPKLREAYERGELTEQEIDEKLQRLTELVERLNDISGKPCEADAAEIRRYTGESFVLLKNDGALPLKTDEKIFVIGKNAEVPRIQGGGCANLRCGNVVSPLQAIRERVNAVYSESFDLSDDNIKELGSYDKILVFLALGEDCDSEAFDRENLFFPKEQTDCIDKLTIHKDKVIAVLTNGSTVDVGFADNVNAILETYYAGTFFGEAAADVLFGDVTPSGKLAETFPMRLEDVPCHKNYGDRQNIVYEEREYVGYRYYTSFGVKTRFPFGFGLSYAKFETDNIKIERKGDYDFNVSYEIKNISEYDGKETVQIYLRTESLFQPKMQLVEFDTVRLDKGQSATRTVKLGREAFERYIGGKKQLFEGEAEICVALSSENLLSCAKFSFFGNDISDINENTPLGYLLQNEKYREKALDYFKPFINYWAFGEEVTDKDFEADKFLKYSVYNMPIRGIAYFSKGALDDNFIAELSANLQRIR